MKSEILVKMTDVRVRPVATADDDQPEMVRSRRRQQRSQDTRSKIISAATDLFAHEGFEGTTTRAIAKEAGVRHALVIYHFETKLALWQAVMINVVKKFNDAFTTIAVAIKDESDPVVRLKELQAQFIRMGARHPELHWLMSHEAGRGGERLTWLLENVIGHSWSLFVDLRRKCQRLGRYVDGDPRHLQYLFLGAAGRVFMLASEAEQLMGRPIFDDEFIEEHIRLCNQLFFRDPPETSSS